MSDSKLNDELSLIGPIDENMQIAGEKYMKSAGFNDLPDEVPGVVRQIRMWASDGFSRGWVAARTHYQAEIEALTKESDLAIDQASNLAGDLESVTGVNELITLLANTRAERLQAIRAYVTEAEDEAHVAPRLFRERILELLDRGAE